MSQNPTKDSYDLKMYTQRKASLEITPAEPQFVVRYVGKTEVYVAIGKGCTQNAVQKIWDNCRYDQKQREMERVSVLINPIGIIISDPEGKSKDRVYSIKDIAYCCAEKDAHERVFTWISKPTGTKKLECHAVLCASKERAQLMALTLHKAFYVAYKDWKQLKERKARAKSQAKKQNEKRIMQNGYNHRNSSQGSSVESQSDGSDTGSDGALMETIMGQMNIVEEEEITASKITVENNLG